MGGSISDQQWDIIRAALEKIDQIAEKQDDMLVAQYSLRTEIELLKYSINGNGTKGIKQRIEDIECREKKANEKKQSDREAAKKNKTADRRNNKGLVVAIIIAILGSAALNTIIESIIP